MLELFFKFELTKIGKFFKTKKLAKIITTSLFLLVFLFVAFGIYGFFISSLRYINIIFEPEFKLPLLLFIYEFFLIILAFVIMLSSMVTGLFNLFRGENNNWLISTPAYKLFPRIVTLKSLVSSLWPLLIMFLPMVLAFNKTYHLGFISLLLIIVSVLLLVFLLNALTLSIIIAVGYSYYLLAQKIKNLRFTFGRLISILFVILTIGTISIWNAVRNIDLVKMFKADDIDTIVSISNISDHFSWLPTHPFALLIMNLQNGETISALSNFAILLVHALVLMFVWLTISPLYYPMWQKFQEGSRKIDTKEGALMQNKMVYKFSGSSTMALFKKEALVSSRNFKGILWFLFLMFIWILEIGTNSVLGHNLRRYESDISQQINLLQTFQFIIAVYFISAFTLRFVFPSFSVEKKTAWILASAPLNFKKIFLGKYSFYSLFFVLVGIIMSYINISTLHVPFVYAFYSMVLFISVIIFIVTFGLSLGALFPNTETDDPEIISTSLAGLFFTALALVYGAISDYILYVTLKTGNTVLLISFVIFTILLVIMMLFKTQRLLSK